MNLTVIVPTLNEEKDLPRTLKSLEFASEILVVDSGSTDSTVSIAKKYNTRIVTHTFKNFASQRNYADSIASNDWILSIEADVVVPPSLAQEILTLPDTPAVYKIGRINMIWGKPIIHADWGPKDDNHVRLYHRSLGKWHGDVHELFVSKTPQKQLKNHLIHHNYETVSEFVTKLNSYSDHEVTKRRNSSQKFSYKNLIIEPLREFVKRYFYKLGFLDGLHGFFLCLLQSTYYFIVNVKLAFPD